LNPFHSRTGRWPNCFHKTNGQMTNDRVTNDHVTNDQMLFQIQLVCRFIFKFDFL